MPSGVRSVTIEYSYYSPSFIRCMVIEIHLFLFISSNTCDGDFAPHSAAPLSACGSYDNEILAHSSRVVGLPNGEEISAKAASQKKKERGPTIH